MIAAQVSAEGPASEQISGLVPALRERLQAEVDRLSIKLVNFIREDFLNGPRPEHLSNKSGALAASIAAQPTGDDAAIGVSVGSGMGVDSYAGAWELGFAPHTGPRGGMRTARMKFQMRRRVTLSARPEPLRTSLRSVAVRQQRQRSQHGFQCRPFVRPAFESMQDEIISGLAEAGANGIEGAF